MGKSVSRITRASEVSGKETYVWIIGNLINSSLIELSAVALHTAKVVAVLDAAVEAHVTPCHVGTVSFGQPVLVGFESSGRNLILHHHDVGVGNNILGVRYRKDIGSASKASGRQGQAEELAEDSHDERGLHRE